MSRKLDMQALLRAMDRRDFGFFDRLDDDAKKEFVYSVIMRWAHDTGSTAYLELFNERVNQFGDLMWKYPDLAFAMMASCGSGRIARHNYSAAPKSLKEDRTLLDFLEVDWPGINQEEADILLSQMDKATFTDLVRSSTVHPNDQKKVLDAYGKKCKKR